MGKKNTSSKRRNFGVFLGALRDAQDESQQEFADRLNVSLSLIGNTETGTPPSETFIERLITEFPDRETEILAAAQPYRKPRARTTRSTPHERDVVRKLQAWRAANELAEARAYLIHELDTNTANKLRFHVWALGQLSQVERLLGQREASGETLSGAIGLATGRLGLETELCGLLEQRAISCLQDDDRVEAHVALIKALAIAPTSASLWYRKGLTHYADGDLSGAFAALTMALGYKGSRLDILFARGLVCAEWGLIEETIADLTEVLASPELVPSKAIKARSALSYAQFLSAEKTPPQPARTDAVTDAVLELDTIVTEAPDNPWSYYFRALCAHKQYTFMRMAERLIQATEPDALDEYGKVITALRDAMRADFAKALACDDGVLEAGTRVRISNYVTTLEGQTTRT